METHVADPFKKNNKCVTRWNPILATDAWCTPLTTLTVERHVGEGRGGVLWSSSRRIWETPQNAWVLFEHECEIEKIESVSSVHFHKKSNPITRKSLTHRQHRPLNFFIRIYTTLITYTYILYLYIIYAYKLITNITSSELKTKKRAWIATKSCVFYIHFLRLVGKFD